MKKKALKIIAVVFGVLIVLWAAMLITDITRSNDFEEPVFAKLHSVQPNEFDDSICEYQGIGYTVRQEKYADEDGNVYPLCSEVWLFGMPVSAVIV